MKTLSILVVLALLPGCASIPAKPQAREILLAPEISTFATAPSGNFIVIKGPSQPEHSKLVAETRRILAQRYVIYDSIEDVPAKSKRLDPTQPLHVELINGIVFHYGLSPITSDCIQITHASDTQEQARAWMVTKACWNNDGWKLGKPKSLVTF